PNLLILGHIPDSIVTTSPLCLCLGGHPMSKKIEHISILQAIIVGFQIYSNKAEPSFSASMNAAFKTRNALNVAAEIGLTDEDLAEVIRKNLPEEN
nr:hypothetical protein [Lachnospiraceae bacterium]